MTYQPEHSPGDIIYGRYKIISFIARGGFGETYKVEDTQQAGLYCLLKYLKPLNTSPKVLRIAEEKFRQEADTLRRLGTHNQIPQLYDYFEEDLRFYLVEEYIDGQNLSKEPGAELFSETKVIEVLYDVLKILDYLYQNNVIHRDIKPDNLIRRTSDNKIVLVDFGAVKEVSTLVVNAQGQTVLTMAIGTPGFMAPEQVAGKPEFATDIYALGVTGFFLLTRQIPPNNQNDELILNGLQLEPHFAKILANMLRHRHEERYQTPSDVLEDLEPLTLLNQTLNQRYEIKKYLDGEGLSHTYFAEDQQRPYQAECIIKRLKLPYNNQRLLQEAQNRFATAVESLRKLSSHQQIPQLSNHFQSNKELYLAYDFIQGEPLNRTISLGNRLSEAEVIVLLKDVLEILSFIHKQGVIHGDIKPSNLIRRQQDGKFCLINFAEFKQVTSLKMNSQHISAPPGGTDGYMAPEQYHNKLQETSDIYALGITAIQALTGMSPDQLQRDSQNEIIWRNQVKVSPKLARILDKMARFQTGKRYQSAQKVLDDLNAQTWRDKFEKYWLIFLFIFVFFGIGIGYIFYKVDIETKKDDTRKLGYSKISEGNALKKSGDLEGAKNAYLEAIQQFEKVIKIEPEDIKTLLNKSYAHVQREDFIGQGHSCIEAIRIDDKNSHAWLCLGNAQLAVKQYEDSIKSFTQATNSCNSQGQNEKDTCVAAWSNIGYAYLGWNKPKEALDAFNQALGIRKDYDKAIYGRIEAEKRLKK